jgi:protein involved in polysaccharide export with SLBB domain
MIKHLLSIAIALLFSGLVYAQTESLELFTPDSVYSANNKLKAPVENKKDNKGGNKTDTVYVPELSVPVTTRQEAAAEAAQRVIQSAAAKSGGLNIYGHSLFTDQSLEVFRTSDGAQAPDTYILGAGDEIRITIFGASQTDMQIKINNEGYIQPTGMSKIFLQGLSLEQARNLLLNRLSTFFTFRSDQLSVTISTARTILVNVFGETRITGGFNISALNSAFNALSAAGGPTEIGSVRNIQMIRGNTRKTIDLYAFMSNPAVQFQFDLQQNDILFVPVAQNLVSIEGAIKRPMLYEMLPGESMTDLIRYAGGVNVDVYPNFVQIQRYMDGEIKLLEWNLADVVSGKIKIALQNGDIIRIRAIGKPLEQFVNIAGSVYYPGRFDLVNSPTLSSLLDKAQPTTQAKKDLVFVERVRPDETVEVLTLLWADLQTAGKDFDLRPGDRITVPMLASYRDVATIAVSGQVRDPFEKTLALGDRITVKQALELAGGLKTSAYPVAYIFRKNLLNPLEMQYIRIDLAQANEILLQPGDQLNVYDNTLFTNIGEVKIFGAVKKPHGMTYHEDLTLRDLITTAGGLTIGAALNRVEVFRTILSPTEPVKLDIITLQIDTAFKVVTPANFVLQPYDQVVIRLTPDFTMGRLVEINGEVKYPGTYVLESKQVQLSEIIRMAGGLLESADARGSRLFRSFNKVGSITMDVSKALRKTGNVKFDPILMEGDVINITRLENTVTIRYNGTKLSEYSGSSDGAINLVYQGSKSAKWYINNFTGGFLSKADRNSVTVIAKNGQMKGTSRTILWIRKYPKVSTGSLINIRMKPPKK